MIAEARIKKFIAEDKGYVIALVQYYDYELGSKKGKDWSHPSRAAMPKKLFTAWGIMNKKSVFFNIFSGRETYPQIRFRSLSRRAPSAKYTETPNADTL